MASDSPLPSPLKSTTLCDTPPIVSCEIPNPRQMDEKRPATFVDDSFSSAPGDPNALNDPVSEPYPRNVSREELDILQSCLTRWRTEVEQDVKGQFSLAVYL